MVIHVRVVDVDDRPVPGAAVYVRSAPRSMPDIAQLTDDTGSVAIAAPVAGEYVLGARTDKAAGEVTVTVTDDDVDVQIKLIAPAE
jgi:hypothetical protein